MLAREQRLTRAAEFAAVTRRGRRVTRRRVVLHLRVPPVSDLAVHGPDVDVRDHATRMGLVVSKKVGNAVVRHEVSRRLRHVVRPLLERLPVGSVLVVRATPVAAAARSADLARDVGSGVRELTRRSER